jgi:membrane fusion protein (multidrug efflux system)
LLWALGLSVAPWVPGCGKTNQYVEPPPPEVTIATPVQQDVTRYLEITGTAQPVVSVEIRARVRGFLTEQHFREGSVVKKDELLFVIDEVPFQVKLAQAKANLEEAAAVLRKAEQSRGRELAQAQVAVDEAALAQAESNAKRLRGLVAERTVTQDDYERADALRKQAAAQVLASRAALYQAKADFDTNKLAAKASIAAAQTAVRNAEIELSYCRMTAPVGGRITDVNVDVGNLVGDGESTPLATIVQLDPIHVYMTLSESDFLKYDRRGNPSGDANAVELGLANDDKYPHRGTVDYHDPSIDSGTGTIRLRAVFPNADGTILPGTFARLRLPLEQQSGALLVPERAFGVDQSGQYLLIVKPDDVVEHRGVKSGPRLEGFRVVEGQISPSDRVIVEGLLRARPGMKVVPKSNASPATAATDAEVQAVVEPSTETTQAATASLEESPASEKSQ